MAGAKKPSPGRAKPTRTERLEAARRARRRKEQRTRAIVAGVVALLVVVIAVVVVTNKKEASANRNKLTAGSCSFDTKADPIDPPPANHVPPTSYKADPPAGGDHDPSAAAAGDYTLDQATPPPDAQVVHALEHGYVAVWVRPDLSDTELAAARQAYDKYPDDVLLVPRPSLKGKAAATAWGRRLLCSDVEAASLTDFTRLYRNEGPEKIPHT